jgi:multicomponent Na+:H+ antiporter subunit E
MTDEPETSGDTTPNRTAEDATESAANGRTDAQAEPPGVPQTDASQQGPARWLVLGVAFAVLWLFVRGVELTDHGAFAPWPVVGEFGIGLLVGVPIAYLFRRFYSPTPVIVRTPRAILAGVKYTAVFLFELITANVDVARRVLSPSMPIDPAVVEVPLRVETDLAVTTIANSITLTPGTLTMDYDPDRNALYVHTLAATDPEEVIAPIRSWEDYALVLFDERLDPGSPVPDPDAPSESSDSSESLAGDEPTTGDEPTAGDEPTTGDEPTAGDGSPAGDEPTAGDERSPDGSTRDESGGERDE